MTPHALFRPLAPRPVQAVALAVLVEERRAAGVTVTAWTLKGGDK